MLVGVNLATALMALGLLCSCGQATRDSNPSGEGGMGSSGAGSSGASTAGAGTAMGGAHVSGAGGNAPTAGTADEPSRRNPLSGASLEEVFPWIVVDANSSPPPREVPLTDDGVLRLAFMDAPVRATLSTHNHFEIVSIAERIEFSAVASEDLTLRVSLKRDLTSGDYFAASEQGLPWPSAVVNVSTSWRRFSIQSSELKPRVDSGGTGGVLSSFMIAFIVEHPRAVELSLDDVRIE
jgi:hypothetical protein